MDDVLNQSATEANHVVVYGDWRTASSPIVSVPSSRSCLTSSARTDVRPVSAVDGWGGAGADSVNDSAFRALNFATTD